MESEKIGITTSSLSNIKPYSKSIERLDEQSRFKTISNLTQAQWNSVSKLEQKRTS